MLGKVVGCVAVLAALAAFDCAPTEATPPTVPDCPDDGSCTSRPPVGGVGAGTGSGGTGGNGAGGSGGAGGVTDAGASGAGGATDYDADAGTLTVAYSVRATVDNWFYAASNYGGPVVVRSVGPDGRVVAPDDAGAPTPGILAGVPLGLNWFAVADGTTARRISSTLQPLGIDSNTSTLDLRAISTDALSSLVVDQVVWSPPAGTATIILTFRHDGRAVAGVNVQRGALPAGTSIAYDSNNGYVSDEMVLGGTAVTDSQGVAIVRGIPGTLPFPALSSTTFRYSLTKSSTSFPAIEVKIARDMVTWIPIEMP